jgi:hypothetical protein
MNREPTALYDEPEPWPIEWLPEIIGAPLVGAIAVLSFEAASLPEQRFENLVLFGFLWLCIIGISTLAAAGTLLFLRYRRAVVRALPLLLALVLYQAWTHDVPDRARFALSRSALDHAADRVVTGRAVEDGRIGWYDIDGFTKVDRGVMFEMRTPFGVSYLTRDVPPDTSMACQQLDDRWRLCRAVRQSFD